MYILLAPGDPPAVLAGAQSPAAAASLLLPLQAVEDFHGSLIILTRLSPFTPSWGATIFLVVFFQVYRDTCMKIHVHSLANFVSEWARNSPGSGRGGRGATMNSPASGEDGEVVVVREDSSGCKSGDGGRLVGQHDAESRGATPKAGEIQEKLERGDSSKLERGARIAQEKLEDTAKIDPATLSSNIPGSPGSGPATFSSKIRPGIELSIRHVDGWGEGGVGGPWWSWGEVVGTTPDKNHPSIDADLLLKCILSGPDLRCSW